jgi:hypothetical protein
VPTKFWIARERLWRSRNLRNPLVDEPHELSSLGGNTLIRVPLVRLAKLSQGVLMDDDVHFSERLCLRASSRNDEGRAAPNGIHPSIELVIIEIVLVLLVRLGEGPSELVDELGALFRRELGALGEELANAVGRHPMKNALVRAICREPHSGRSRRSPSPTRRLTPQCERGDLNPHESYPTGT